MNRSEFLKRLGVGIVAVPLVPKIFQEVVAPDNSFLELSDTPDEYFPGQNNPILEKPGIHDEMVEKFGHYEEPWIYDAHPWPLIMNDIVITDEKKSYIVTEVRYGEAILTPVDGRDDVIIAHKGDKMIRFANFKSLI